MRARRAERWHDRSHVAIARGGSSKTWHAMAGMGTGMGVGAAGCARMLTRFVSPSRGPPGSIQSRDVRATFLLPFHVSFNYIIFCREGESAMGIRSLTRWALLL